jgi:hypothetical protein
MQYALLIYTDPSSYAAVSEEDMQKVMDGYWAFEDEVRGSKEHVVGEALQGTETATTVRVKAGEALTTDGPFAETKEVLGGFYIVDVPDIDRALELAAKIPDAAVGNGAVEVRPIQVFTREEDASS